MSTLALPQDTVPTAAETSIETLLLSFNCLLYLVLSVVFLWGLESASCFALFTAFEFSFLFLERKYRALTFFNISTVLVLLFLLIQQFAYGHVYWSDGLSDDWEYEQSALEYYDIFGIDYRNLREYYILHNSIGYVYVVILLMKFGSFFDGYHHLLPILTNAAALQLCVVYMQKYCRWSDCSSRSKIILPLFGLLPPILCLVVSYVFRDVLIMLFLVMAFYYVRAPERIGAIKRLLMVAVAVFCLAYLRKEVSFVLAAVSAAFFLFRAHHLSFGKMWWLALLGGCGLTLFLLTNANIFERIDVYSELRAEGSSGILGRAISLPMYLGIFPRVAFLTVNPIFIFNWTQGFAGSLFLLNFFFYPVILSSFTQKEIDIALKAFFGIFFLIAAISTFTFRHILMFLPFGWMLFYKTLQIEGALKNLFLYFCGYCIFFVLSVAIVIVF